MLRVDVGATRGSPPPRRPGARRRSLRAIVSSLGLLASVAITKPSQTTPTKRDGGRAASRGPCERRAAPRSSRSRRRTRTSDDERDGDAGELLRSVDRVGDARVGRDRQQVARVRLDQCPDDLPGERHREGAGDGQPRDGRTAPPFRKASSNTASTATQSRSRTNRVSRDACDVRPLEIRAQNGESRRGEQPPRSTPARPLQDDEGRRDQSPGKREVGGDPRARTSARGRRARRRRARLRRRRAATSTGSRSTSRRRLSRGCGSADVTRGARRTWRPRASTSG